MKQTEQYDLNQWDRSDRIRMEDFNADNAKIEAALKAEAEARAAALAGLGGELETQAAALAALSGRVDGMATTTDLNNLKTTLRNADVNLQKKIPGPTNIFLNESRGFVPSADGTRFELDLSEQNLGEYMILCLTISMSYSREETFYLNDTGLDVLSCKCVSTQGISDKGMAILTYNRPTTFIFFPAKNSLLPAGGIFLGEICGIGCARLPYSQIDRLTLTPASGEPVDTHFKYNVALRGIK